jgi:hypothetical protein
MPECQICGNAYCKQISGPALKKLSLGNLKDQVTAVTSLAHVDGVIRAEVGLLCFSHAGTSCTGNNRRHGPGASLQAMQEVLSEAGVDWADVCAMRLRGELNGRSAAPGHYEMRVCSSTCAKEVHQGATIILGCKHCKDQIKDPSRARGGVCYLCLEAANNQRGIGFGGRITKLCNDPGEDNPKGYEGEHLCNARYMDEGAWHAHNQVSRMLAPSRASRR